MQTILGTSPGGIVIMTIANDNSYDTIVVKMAVTSAELINYNCNYNVSLQ